MSQYDNAPILRNLTLGKATEYKNTYDPSLLQAVPRSLNREELNIINNDLPFVGEDVWYGYEVSWLNSKGKPIVKVAEFRVPCSSINIIESKSFKLYLNSFNQTQFNNEAEVVSAMIKDLSATAQAEVAVSLFDVEHCQALAITKTQANCIDHLDIEMNDYQLLPQYLVNATSEQQVSESLVSHLLKSNCLITNQPDWASIYIDYSGKQIDQQKLLKYIISFREHNEFHEQCVERIFNDIMHYCQPQSLSVYARYTRRGGLDINPYRSTHQQIAPNHRTLRQ